MKRANQHSLKVMSVSIALLCVLVLAGCAHEHSWVEANCTTAKHCSDCDATEGSALGHEIVGVTCTSDGMCTRCNATVPASGHVLSDATCTEPATCTVCGETSGEALGHSEVDGVCQSCGLKTNTVGSGSGDKIISDILVGEGLYRVRLTHDGSKLFAVKSYDKNGNSELLTNVMGKYDGVAVLRREGPYSLEITADGNWTYEVEPIKEATETKFSGNGDSVTDYCYVSSGGWKITSESDGYFGVWLYTSEGRDLLINCDGRFDQNVMVTVPAGSYVYFAVSADGNWTIEKT